MQIWIVLSKIINVLAGRFVHKLNCQKKLQHLEINIIRCLEIAQTIAVFCTVKREENRKLSTLLAFEIVEFEFEIYSLRSVNQKIDTISHNN